MKYIILAIFILFGTLALYVWWPAPVVVKITLQCMVRYNHRYGRLGNRVFSFAFAYAVARANRCQLFMSDNVLPLFFNLTPFQKHLRYRMIEGEVDSRYFRDGKDLAVRKQFSSFLIDTNATIIDLGFSYDYTNEPIPPKILSSLQLQDSFYEAATSMLSSRNLLFKSYDCLHHRGTDFRDSSLYVSLEKSAEIIVSSFPNRSVPLDSFLFVSTDEPASAVRHVLFPLLPNNTLFFAPVGQFHTIDEEDEDWDVSAIGISIAICSRARRAFLNSNSTFSFLISLLASSLTKIVYLTP